MEEKDYFETIENNYEKVFSHFTEQDHLRNEALTFFTAISSAVIGFANESTEILIVNFLLGVLFSLLLCRYKYYGNLYNATMKILRFLSLDKNNMKREKMEDKLKSETKGIKLSLYSADFIIYCCLILINTTILYFTIKNIESLAAIIIICVMYSIFSVIVYYELVIDKTKQLKLENLSFIDMFVENEVKLKK